MFVLNLLFNVTMYLVPSTIVLCLLWIQSFVNFWLYNVVKVYHAKLDVFAKVCYD